MKGSIRVHANLHIDSDTVMRTDSGEAHDWLKLGGPILGDGSRVALHFEDDDDVIRMIVQLRELRRRMRERAHLPEPDTAPVDPVAESLDRETAGVVR